MGFTLSDSNQNGYNAPSSGPSFEGEFTREPGHLAYYEICNQEGTRVWDDEGKVPYAYSGDQWVGYDDQQSLAVKVQWMRAQNFGGWMIWSLDQDDFNNSQCGQGKYPLLHVLNSN